MNEKTTFSMIGTIEIETNVESDKIISVRCKDKTFRVGNFVMSKKYVRGFSEGTRGIIVAFWKPSSRRSRFIEIHFQNQEYSHTMKLCEIEKS